MNVYTCTICDYQSMSKKYICPKCLKGKLEQLEVAATGIVYSFTDIHIAPGEFAPITPYTIALIQLDDTNVKVTARVNCPVQIGDSVELNTFENGAYLFNKRIV